jgi:hypothetical protein
MSISELNTSIPIAVCHLLLFLLPIAYNTFFTETLKIQL